MNYPFEPAKPVKPHRPTKPKPTYLKKTKTVIAKCSAETLSKNINNWNKIINEKQAEGVQISTHSWRGMVYLTKKVEKLTKTPDYKYLLNRYENLYAQYKRDLAQYTRDMANYATRLEIYKKLGLEIQIQEKNLTNG